jgi:hypothetical protein
VVWIYSAIGVSPIRLRSLAVLAFRPVDVRLFILRHRALTSDLAGPLSGKVGKRNFGKLPCGTETEGISQLERSGRTEDIVLVVVVALFRVFGEYWSMTSN